LKGLIMRKILFSLGASITLVAGLLVGCGGGGGGGGTPAAPAASDTTISGSAIKGPVNGGKVTVRNASSGAILGTTTTSPAGTYSLTISYNGDVVIEVEGGNYVDEATGASTPLNQLKAYANASGGAQTAHITPLTYIAYSYAGGTRAGFNTALNNLATQFGLGSTNLLTTLPAVSGTVNDYGRVLRAMSQYVQSQKLANFDAFLNQAIDPTSFTSMQANFAAAFNTINQGQALTFAFNGSGITVGGTGAGGGSGTCGVNVTGSITANGFNVPLNLNYCVSGIAAGSCTTGNTSLSQALRSQQGVVGATNLNYSYSASCASGAFAINLAQ
jgi:hypothetical protein